MKVVGICGISGSGKSFLIKELKKELNNVSVLSLDDYYQPLELQQKDKKGIENFDLPTSINLDKVLMDIDTLSSGVSLKLNKYLFNNASAKPKEEIVVPKEVLLVEGIFVLGIKALREKMDFILRVGHMDLHGILRRRIKRDVEDRGMTEELVKYQWHNHVLPGYEKFVKPYEHYANVVLENDFLSNAYILKAKEILEEV